jgi:hypothetical protein
VVQTDTNERVLIFPSYKARSTKPMKPTYQIKDWDTHFENHDSRRITNARWFPMPNKHDGKSYRRIAAHAEGIPVFTAWTLMLEVASKMPARGILADEDGPLDAEDLSSMTGFPAHIFEAAFKVLTEQRIGWLQVDLDVVLDRTDRERKPLETDTPHNVALEGNNKELNNKEEERAVGSRGKPRSPNTEKGCDEEFIERLQQGDAYSMLNVRVELARMVHWCEMNRKIPTRRRLIAWLNRADVPMEKQGGTSKPASYKTAAERRESTFNGHLAIVSELRRRSSGTTD